MAFLIVHASYGDSKPNFFSLFSPRLACFVKAADAMILELEALMSEVDKAQNSLDAKKRKNALDQTIEADLAVRNSLSPHMNDFLYT